MTDRNPFRPGVGLPPPHLAGRDREQDVFRRTLHGAPEIPGNVRVTGLRGVGKTVLLQRFQTIAEDEDWAAVLLEVQPRQSNEAELVSTMERVLKDTQHRLSTTARVRARAKGTLDTVRRMAKIDFEGFEWSLAGDLEAQTAELGAELITGAEAAVQAGRRGLVLLLDEAQILTDDKRSDGDHPLSTLIAAVSTVQKGEVPICLVMCGLPTLAVNLLAARTYTERMFRGIEVASLNREDARDAFVEPLAGSEIAAGPALVEAVMSEVEGYPYFIQLWGAELWDATKDARLPEMTIETLYEISERIYERLDLDFYEPRIASLTPAEQDLLIDSSRCPYPPLVVSELNGESMKSAGNVNVLLGRLVAANVIYRLRKGQYEYTAPGFRDFLRRRNPPTV